MSKMHRSIQIAFNNVVFPFVTHLFSASYVRSLARRKLLFIHRQQCPLQLSLLLLLPRHHRRRRCLPRPQAQVRLLHLRRPNVRCVVLCTSWMNSKLKRCMLLQQSAPMTTIVFMK